MVSTEQFNEINCGRLQLKKFEEPRWPADDSAKKREPKTPSEWFSKHFPEAAKKYGCPFIELHSQTLEGFSKTNPLAQNIDFLAGILGGDPKLGLKVVYVEGEMAFYAYDPRQKLFIPVSEEKLGNLLRAYLIRCAEELPDNVHKLNLFLAFRSNEAIRAVIHRARSILAADDTFFSAESNNNRRKGQEVHERVARIFVDQILERQAGEVLTLTNAHLLFCEYLRLKGLDRLDRKFFKGMFAPLIKEAFGVGLRNDVVNTATNKETTGWKDLHAQNIETSISENPTSGSSGSPF